MPRKSGPTRTGGGDAVGRRSRGTPGRETGSGPGLVPPPAGCRLEPLARSVTMESAQGCPNRFEETGLGAAYGPRRIRRTVGVLVALDLTGSARRAR
ncbi:hypothetical protein GA0115256_10772 [Streptomyces sp. DconLS]|nr:hypothetical protein GA0115256_10772 [Streptomyces sp. DconLS]SCG03946.1 hypothetical protein GA0115258_127017 [Streptomyces sp. LamerLS-31b]